MECLWLQCLEQQLSWDTENPKSFNALQQSFKIVSNYLIINRDNFEESYKIIIRLSNCIFSKTKTDYRVYLSFRYYTKV